MINIINFVNKGKYPTFVDLNPSNFDDKIQSHSHLASYITEGHDNNFFCYWVSLY